MSANFPILSFANVIDKIGKFADINFRGLHFFPAKNHDFSPKITENGVKMENWKIRGH
jgi:hypothetical protein